MLCIRAVLPSVTHVDPRDATVLGAPVGGDVIIDAVLFRKLKDFRRLAKYLKNLNTHDAFYRLKHCFSLPMLWDNNTVYWLWQISAICYDSQLINQYDDSIRSTLWAILNVSLTDDGWRQAKLPVKHGGLGVLSASDIQGRSWVCESRGIQLWAGSKTKARRRRKFFFVELHVAFGAF